MNDNLNFLIVFLNVPTKYFIINYKYLNIYNLYLKLLLINLILSNIYIIPIIYKKIF